MNDELSKIAAKIAADLVRLDEERRRIGLEGLKVLERLDPETATLAGSLWDNPERAADWFTNSVQSLQWRTPWQCIADGRQQDVRKILNSIAYGIPM